MISLDDKAEGALKLQRILSQFVQQTVGVLCFKLETICQLDVSK